MRIASASIDLAAAYSRMEVQTREERLRAWVRLPSATEEPPKADPAGDISAAGRAAQAKDEDSNCDPRLNIIRLIVEALTGRSIRVFDPGKLRCDDAPPALEAPPPTESGGRAAGFGLEYDLRETTFRSEQLDFSASGSIKTADGRSIDFQIAFSLQRETLTETSVSLRLGEAAKQKDPLVVNFSGNAAQLDSTAFAFDLDGDGTVEHLAAPVAGSGFLAIDRNGNGTIDHGGELFGPASGDGFSELAALDADGNAWIDENDPQFAQLRYWNPLADPEGKSLSLSQAGIGALSLSPVATPFDLYGSNASLLGSLRSTGIALRESGEAGTISHIDLTA